MTSVIRVIFVLTLTPVSSALAVDEALLQAEAERVTLIERTKQPVIAVFAVEGEGGGSGVLISPDGFALTNFHVARPSGEWLKCGLPDGCLYDAVIVGVDPVGDVALIKLFGRDDFPAAALGDSDRVQVGDRAYVMGNPFLLAADFQPTVTSGIISGVHRYQFPSGTLLEYADCLQTDASINPGNSGGPLFDAAGLLVGIVGRASFEKRGRVNVGAGYAISINQVRRFLGHLHSGRIVDHATLGATVAFDDAQRVVVTEILDGSDAHRRGLRYDDEIVSLDRRPVTTPNGFKNILGTIPKGWRVPLSFRRDGVRSDVLVRLAGVHAESELLEKLESLQADELPIPRRNPGKDEKPGEIPAPIEPIETPGGNRPTRPDMPEVVRQHLEERAGYANYYFNRQHRTRVLDGWLAKLDPAQRPREWRLSGKTSSESAFRLLLTDKGASIELAESRYDWLAGDDLTEDLQPEGSGGMLPALYLWRYLATHPVEDFGEVSYLGTAPYPGREDLLDVVSGTRRGLEVWFYFDPNDARLVGLEMWSDPARDPCEIRFSEYTESSVTPGRIEVIYGDVPFTDLRINAQQ